MQTQMPQSREGAPVVAEWVAIPCFCLAKSFEITCRNFHFTGVAEEEIYFGDIFVAMGFGS